MAPETSLSRPAAPVEARLDAAGLPAARTAALREALAAAGVRPCPHARNGIVVLDPRRPGAADRVRALAGPGRLLVLSPSEAPVGDAGWALLRAGASDVLAWTGDEVAPAVARRLRRWQVVDELLDCPYVREFLVGDSAVWRSVLREAVEAARFTTAAVLITGESGTGKERMAQLIHDLDPRPAKKKLVILDCSTVVPSLSGSEFFGHDKGAFTGASVARAGAFELADGGTLFLDEVGELPVTLQAELLRVIQEGTYKRVGSNIWRKSTFRLICATNRDLAVGQATGAFRGDFFHRISGCTLHLPALRERVGDIIPLVEHFFRQATPGREPPPLSGAVRELLVRRSYPGNVRDLRGLALRIVHRHLGDGEISIGDVPDRERPPAGPAATTDRGLEEWVRGRLARGDTLEEITAGVQEKVVRLAMLNQGGNPRLAARSLGVPGSTPLPSGETAVAPAG
ncbi:sigma 54-interacting transcriptional regulator [Micromonospora sp. IBHARD004]|uniref:sigma 54-interacting transcriptional regulator n=1 Tax=Micromonospora sp. IBHARD004 TaxID=3457764 RepID=UPI004059CB34